MRGRARLLSPLCAALLLAAVPHVRAEEAPSTAPPPGDKQTPGEEPAERPPGVTRLAAIAFTGNARTREQVLRQEIELREGEPATGEQIEAARQAIMDLGLFEWVRARVEQRPEGEQVTFDMKEKLYFLPIPLLNGDPSKQEYSYGLEVRADNLAGLNQTVKIKYEEEQSVSLTTPLTRRGSIVYAYPRVGGSAYNLSMGYSVSQQDLNMLDSAGHVTAEYHRDVHSVELGVSRWLNIAGPSRGWSGGMGIGYQQQDYRFLSGVPGLRETEQAVSLTAGIGWSDVHDKGYYYTGSAYGWRGELGDEIMGSDFDFTRHLFYYRTYYRYTPQINLNWQLRIGFADGDTFGSPAYSIGGFSTLRGYETSIDGNALALSNLEYHHQMDDYPSVRGVWFLDVGNAYKSIGHMEPGKLEAGTGLGLRWRIQSLVKVTLSADMAWGIGPEKKVFYLMTTNTF